MKFRNIIILIFILLISYVFTNNLLIKYQKELDREIKSLPKKIYLIKNDNYKLNIKFDIINNIKWKSNNNKILEVINNNELIGISKGNTYVYTNVLNKKIKINVNVTDLLLSNNDEYNINKEFLSCNKYTKEQNDIIDKYLEYQINNVGYNTRAGVVEAARFLTINFPYKINYFYENGRGTTYGINELVHGEGRYYNKGLYLNKNKYENILYSKHGPAIWGCDIYNETQKKNVSNGLDCSGFLSWAFINAGYDPGDIGAGITDVYDYTDTGEKRELTQSLINENKIKVGDLLHSNRAGGHIAIIIGMDEDNFYVAESIWYEPIGVVMNTYNKKDIINYFGNVILMDNYY